MAAKKRKRRSPSGPGDTISQFATDVGTTPPVIRNAVRNGSIQAVSFNGILRIPPSEKAKYLALWTRQHSAAEALAPDRSVFDGKNTETC